MKTVRDRDGGRASDGGQRQTLGGELTNEASSTRAERQAQRHFGSSRGAAGEQKVGEVRTRNQQQHADGREQRRQRLRELVPRRRRATRAGSNLETLIQEFAAALSGRGRAVERLQAGMKDRVRLGLRLRARDTRFESRKDVEPHRLLGRDVVQPIAAGQDARLRPQREPDIRLLADSLADESRCCDTDDGQRHVTYGQRRAQHVRTPAEASLPVGIADDDLGCHGSIVGRGEQPADRGRNPQHFKESA